MVAVKSVASVRAPISVSRPMPDSGVKPEEIKSNLKNIIQASGLSDAKIKSLHKLDEFHQLTPQFHEDNIRLRNEYLEVLEDRPEETVRAFQKLMKQIGREEDGMKSFILNLTMSLNLSDTQKAAVFTERVLGMAAFRKDGTVEDQDLSLMISLSHLSRLKSPAAKQKAITRILASRKNHSENFLQLLQDYFPEFKHQLRARRILAK